MDTKPDGLKIGIMGGTFDPIHYGHLMIAENAAEQFGLDQIWFMPNGNPPHKRNSNITSAEHRCAMVELAIAGNGCRRCLLYLWNPGKPARRMSG